jgi:hypothetical protein
MTSDHMSQPQFSHKNRGPLRLGADDQSGAAAGGSTRRQPRGEEMSRVWCLEASGCGVEVDGAEPPIGPLGPESPFLDAAGPVVGASSSLHAASWMAPRQDRLEEQSARRTADPRNIL